MNIKLTIGIPIYNGEITIQETLSSIIGQLTPDVEIVISDNASNDNTSKIIKANCAEYDQIKYFRNETNVGADANIDLVVKRSNGTFVWLMGDDDEIAPGGIKKVMEVIQTNPMLAAIFVNYSSYDRLTGKCIEEQTLKINKDIFCPDADTFLKVATIYPNFMSSIIVRKSRWLDYNSNNYMGTHWLQYSMLMKIIEEQTAYCVAFPYVMNRGMEFNGPNEANRNGAAIQVLMNLVDIVDGLPSNVFSEEAKKSARWEAYKFLPRKIFSSKRHGLMLNSLLLTRLFKSFHKYFIFWLRDFPLLLMPRTFHYWIWRIYKSNFFQSNFLKKIPLNSDDQHN